MKPLLFLLFVVLWTFCQAQDTGLNQMVRGQVIDKISKTPIEGATIVLDQSNPLIGTISDSEGNFELAEVPVGRRSFSISYLGYESLQIEDILIGSGKELILTIELVEGINQLNAVEVVGNKGDDPINAMGQISGRSFTVEETKRFPVGVGDPLRLASSFAGVLSPDDETNEIIVRGNNPRGLLWKLEGVEIPSPNHFSAEGAASGGISMFSTQVISRSDFYTGAFAPEYGNATSGVFDIHLRKGNNEKREYTFQAGLLGLDLAAEGPFQKGKSASYLINYRYSTLGLLDQIGISIQDENESNNFQDLSFKFHFPTKKLGDFSVFGLGGLSSFKEEQANIFTEREDYDMGVVGLSHQLSFNPSTFLKTTYALSGTSLKDDFQRFGDAAFEERADFSKTYNRLALTLHKKIDARHLLETGLILSRFSYRFKESVKIPANDFPLNDFDLFDENGASGSQQAYVSWRYRLSEQFSLVSGLHYLRFDLNKEQVVEPRASLKWNINQRQTLSLGFGLHSRLESLEYYFANFINEDGSKTQNNSNLGFTRASHFVASYSHDLGASTTFKAEAYYQSLFDVPVANTDDTELGSFFSTLNVGEGFVLIPLINSGTGTNYGLELSLERRFSNNYFYLFNLSLYNSKFTPADGIERDTRFNGNFASNAIFGKEFLVGKNKKNNILGLNTKMNFSGNKRHTPIDLDLSREAGQAIRPITGLFSERLPNYFRLDVQLSYRKNKPGLTTEWRLDIQNLSNRNNVIGTQFFNPNIETLTSFGIVPVLSYRLEW